MKSKEQLVFIANTHISSLVVSDRYVATIPNNCRRCWGGQSGCVHLDNAEAIGYPTIPEHRAKFEATGIIEEASKKIER